MKTSMDKQPNTLNGWGKTELWLQEKEVRRNRNAI